MLVTEEQINALKHRNTLRKGKPLTSEKALAASRKGCKAMNAVRHSKAGHVVDSVDLVKLTGTCHKCGKVPIKVMKHRANGALRDQYQCWVGTLNRKDRVWADAVVSYPNQALEMWEQQHENCALCGKTMERGGNTTLGVTLDHCHKTGRLRGFIHQGCNKGLGHFFDDPETLRKAAEYLERMLGEEGILWLRKLRKRRRRKKRSISYGGGTKIPPYLFKFVLTEREKGYILWHIQEVEQRLMTVANV